MTPRTPSRPSANHTSSGRQDSAVVQVCGARPFQADGDLVALAFAADGSIWSVEDPGVLRHWHPVRGEQFSWQALDDLAMLWEFSADARLLASAGDEVILWDVATARALTSLPQLSWVTALAFRRDGGLLATGHDDGMVRLWDTDRRRMVRSWRAHPRAVSALAFSREGTRLASAGEDRAVCLWDPAAGRLRGTLLGHTDRVPALAWQPGGRHLYSAGWDTTVRVWDTDSCEPVILLNSHAGQVTALALNAAGTLLASADAANVVRLWAVPANREVQVFPGHEAEVRALAFGPVGQRLASGGSDRVIRLWTGPAAAPGAAAAPAEAPGQTTSPDGKHLIRTGGGTALAAGDPASGPPLVRLDDATTLDAVACSPDGRWIAGSAADAPPRLWDADTGRVRHTLVGPTAPVTALAFAPDSAVLASGSSRGTDVWLWDVRTGEPVLLIPDAVDNCSVEALAFHPQGRLLAAGGVDWLATGGSDGAVCVWDVESRRTAVMLDGAAVALAFHPAGTRLAVASLSHAVRVWDFTVPLGGVRHLPLTELVGHDDSVTCVVYSPDGSRLASGSTDHTVRLWDAESADLLGLATLDSQVKALSFSPDGRYLYTGNGNSSCYQLEVRSLLKG
jgi:WD40 repeat protein